MDNYLSGCVLSLFVWLILLPIILFFTAPFILVFAFVLGQDEETYWQTVIRMYKRVLGFWFDYVGMA